jgi:hypothetical protein
MGSVIDYIECPNCTQDAYSNFYYKTGEEYTFCYYCGYYKSLTIINRDKKLSELTESDWKIKELKNPFGAYRLKLYHQPGFQCGSLENDEQYNNFKTVNEVDVEIEFCSISRLIDGKIIDEIIIDNGPKTDYAGFIHEDNII